MFWICVSWEHEVRGEVMLVRRRAERRGFWKRLPGDGCPGPAPRIPALAFLAWLVRTFFLWCQPTPVKLFCFGLFVKVLSNISLSFSQPHETV